jgi:hypothetical protein
MWHVGGQFYGAETSRALKIQAIGGRKSGLSLISRNSVPPVAAPAKQQRAGHCDMHVLLATGSFKETGRFMLSGISDMKLVLSSHGQRGGRWQAQMMRRKN